MMGLTLGRNSTKRQFHIDIFIALLAAVVISALLGALDWQNLKAMNFVDPDDALRLVQIRDLYAGQSWFDVTQHRINPPFGGLMHWSRLIDLPIVSLIAILTPIMGQSYAEAVTLIVYPAILLVGLIFVSLRILRYYGGPMMVIIGTAMFFTLLPVFGQFRPLRIDHHNMQMLLAWTAFYAAVAKKGRVAGILAGLCLAVHASISLEGLAYVAIFAACFGIPWIKEGDQDAGRFLSYCATFALASIGLLLVTRGPVVAITPYCDAMSQPYLLAAIIGTAMLFAADRLHVAKRWPWRLAALGVAGIAAILAIKLTAPQCFAGPFGSLDPLVHKIWYLRIVEGLPITAQAVDYATYIATFTLLSIAATGFAWSRATTPYARQRWQITFFLLVGAVALCWLVMRTVATALLFGLPGVAWTMSYFLERVQNQPPSAKRVLATLTVFLLNPSLIAPIASNVAKHLFGPKTQVETHLDETESCFNPPARLALKQLPETLIFAGIDAGPTILVSTPHSVVVTGHHRNDAVMAKVIRTFMGSPDQARALVMSTKASHMVICPRGYEMSVYHRLGGGASLAAALQQGHAPPWLVPTPVPAGSNLAIYQIVRNASPDKTTH